MIEILGAVHPNLRPVECKDHPVSLFSSARRYARERRTTYISISQAECGLEVACDPCADGSEFSQEHLRPDATDHEAAGFALGAE